MQYLTAANGYPVKGNFYLQPWPLPICAWRLQLFSGALRGRGDGELAGHFLLLQRPWACHACLYCLAGLKWHRLTGLVRLQVQQ
jgi:hypothetical protein